MSSSTSLSLVSSPSTSFPVTASSPEKINPLALMGNLFSVMERSDATVHGELQETSQAVSQFMELMTQQFQGMAQRIVELESEVIAARAQLQEAKKMNEAQIGAIEQLTQTVVSQNQRLGALESRSSLIESSESTTKIAVSSLEKRFGTHTHYYIDSWTAGGGLCALGIGKNTGGPST